MDVNVEKTRQLIKSVVEILPPKSWKKNQYEILFLDSVKDCSDTEKFIKEHNLTDPKKLLQFFIDLHFDEIDSIISSIESVRDDLLNSVISGLEATKDILENPDGKKDNCINELVGIKRNLERKFIAYAREIQRIDELPFYKFVLGSIPNKRKIDSNISRCKLALEAWLETVKVTVLIENEFNYKTETNLRKAEEFINKIIQEKYISLICAYAKSKERSYWDEERLKKEYKNIQTVSDNLSDYFREVTVDFESEKTWTT